MTFKIRLHCTLDPFSVKVIEFVGDCQYNLRKTQHFLILIYFFPKHNYRVGYLGFALSEFSQHNVAPY